MENEYLNLLHLFHAERVEYVVVGGYAVIAHGFPRTTGDIDIMVRPTAANAQRVVRALVSYGFVNQEFEEADFIATPNFLSFSRHDI
ncbi:MAG: nucleotidyltransferase domain-containing protein [Janthinobacterium lividum]